MSIALTDYQWDTIDVELFAGQQIQALIRLRAFVEISIHDGAYLLDDRFAFLCKTAPQRFTVSTSGYWDDFMLS